MYCTIRKRYSWRGPAIACYETVRNCAPCPLERIKLTKRSTVYAVHSQSTSRGRRNGHPGRVTADSTRENKPTCGGRPFTKIVRVVPLKKLRPGISLERLQHIVRSRMEYRNPVLTDNGSQFAPRVMQELYRTLVVKGLFTTTYNPQRNGQTERYYRTVLVRIAPCLRLAILLTETPTPTDTIHRPMRARDAPLLSSCSRACHVTWPWSSASH